MLKDSYSIVALPGDGIGIEVLACALNVRRAAGGLLQVSFNIEEIGCGGHYYARSGVSFRNVTIELAKKGGSLDSPVSR